MRLPFLQVTQETWSTARMISGALGISVGDAFKMICDLWAWGLDLGPEDEPPTGILRTKHVQGMLAGALEWRSDNDLLLEVLVDAGLVEITDYGMRVKGMDRYVGAWGKRKRDRERQVLGRMSQRHRRDVAATSLGQTQTQTHNLLLPTVVEAAANHDKEKPTSAERKLSTQEKFVKWCAKRRREKLETSGLSETTDVQVERPNAAFKFMAEKPNFYMRVYLKFLENERLASLHPPWPMNIFLKEFGRYESLVKQEDAA